MNRASPHNMGACAAQPKLGGWSESRLVYSKLVSKNATDFSDGRVSPDGVQEERHHVLPGFRRPRQLPEAEIDAVNVPRRFYVGECRTLPGLHLGRQRETRRRGAFRRRCVVEANDQPFALLDLSLIA